MKFKKLFSLCIIACLFLAIAAGCSNTDNTTPSPDVMEDEVFENETYVSEKMTTSMVNLYGERSSADELGIKDMNFETSLKVVSFMPITDSDNMYQIIFAVGSLDSRITCEVPLKTLEELNAVSITTDADGNQTVAMLSNLTHANSKITSKYMSVITDSMSVLNIDAEDTLDFIQEYLMYGSGVNLIDRAVVITNVDFLFSDYIVAGVYDDETFATELFDRYKNEQHTLFIGESDTGYYADFYNITLDKNAESYTHKVHMAFPDFNEKTIEREMKWSDATNRKIEKP